MYNAVVVQYLEGKPIRTFAATVVNGRITASAYLLGTGLEGTPMYEDHMKAHFYSRNTTFAIVEEKVQPQAPAEQPLAADNTQQEERPAAAQTAPTDSSFR